LTLGQAVSAAVCPLYYCDNIETGNCVNIRNGNVTLSSVPCPSGQYCTYTAASAWIETTLAAQTSVSVYNALYSCVTGTFTLKPTSQNEMSCPSKPLLKNLKSGTDPKVCTELGNSSPECELEDQTFAYCACGLDGKAYCNPNIGSSVYSNYWEECTKSSYKGTIESEDHWAYWTLRFSYYIPYMTAYSCAHRLFAEFLMLDELVYTSSAEVLAVLGLVVA
jgi:hypothetical protein